MLPVPHNHLEAQQLKDTSLEQSHFKFMGCEVPLFISALYLIRLCWLQNKTPGYSKAGRELCLCLALNPDIHLLGLHNQHHKRCDLPPVLCAVRFLPYTFSIFLCRRDIGSLAVIPPPTHLLVFAKHFPQTSLGIQWIRICLPTQGTWVRSQVPEDSACHGATKAPKLLEPSHPGAWTLQLLSLCVATEAHVPNVYAPQQGKPPQWETHTLQLE